MAGFFNTDATGNRVDTPETYESMQRKRKLLDALMAKATDTSPIQSWTQGAARLAQAFVGNWQNKELDDKEAASNKAFRDDLMSAYGGGATSTSQPAAASASDRSSSAGAPSTFDPNALPTFAKAAGDQFGVSPDYMAKTAWIESKFNPNADNGVAKGLYQFVPSTAKAYGLADPFDAHANATAAARLASDNRDALSRSLGRAPNDAELYLAHQQGAGGAAKLLANPNAPAASIVGRQAVVQNGGRADMTAGQFANMWLSKYNNLQPKGRNNPADLPSPGASEAGGAPFNPPQAAGAPLSNFQQIPGSAPVLPDEFNPQQQVAAPQAANVPVGLPPGAVPQNAQPSLSRLPDSAVVPPAPGVPVASRDASGALSYTQPGSAPQPDPVAPNPDISAPGAVEAGAGPANDLISQATAARAANPQPGDQRIQLGQNGALPPGAEKLLGALEGSPEARATGAQPGASGSRGVSALYTAPATPGASPAPSPAIPGATGAGVSARSRTLLMMALNPSLSPSQRQMAASAMTALQAQDKVSHIDLGNSIGIMDGRGNIVRQIPKESAPKWEKLNDGTLYDSRTGQTRAANGGPAFRALVDPAERARYGIPANDQKPYQIGADGKLSAVGGNGTNVNVETKTESAFDQSIAKSQAELFTGVATDGMTAKGDLANIQALRDNISKLPGGFLGGAQAIAKSYGISIGPNTSNLEAANAILNKLVPAQRQGMPGAASDRDVQMFKDALPKLSNTPEGNKTIIDTMEALTRHKMAAGEIANRVMTGEMSRKDAMRALQDLPDPMALFKEAQKTPGAPGERNPASPGAASQFSPDEIAAELARRGIK
jgi:hypothetical protein